MQQIFSPSSNPQLEVGQSLFTLSFVVGDPNRLYASISGQLQYLGVSYDMVGASLVKFRFRLRGVETVEFFYVGDGTATTAWLESPTTFASAPGLSRPERPALL